MKVTQIEKLNQLVSRTDMTGNQKVEWLTKFIDEHVTEQLRLNDVSNRRELLIDFQSHRQECNDHLVRHDLKADKYLKSINCC